MSRPLTLTVIQSPNKSIMVDSTQQRPTESSKGNYLSQINKHPRDDNISFQEDGHIYTVSYTNKQPISVTTIIHDHFPQFDADIVITKMMKSRNWPNSKYFGQTKENIKAEWDNSGKLASELGTLMHADIERFLNNEPILNSNTIEFKYFMQFWEGFQSINPSLRPYRTEWLVYDEDKNIAGSIDCVLSDNMGNSVILDWKRSKEIKYTNTYEKGLAPFEHLDNCNYNHYTLQLNIYRHILETRYNKNIIDMFIVVLHPDDTTFKVHQIKKYDIARIWDILFLNNHK